MNRALYFGLFVFILSLPLTSHYGRFWLQADPRLIVLDRDANPTSQIIDGNLIRLQLENMGPLPADSKIDFFVEGYDQVIASCSMEQGKSICISDPFAATGWFWGADAIPQPERSVAASLADGQILALTSLQVQARPVVMVHGFSSNYSAWTNYLGLQGFLAQLGVSGFAVGDGQVPGVMNTGELADPLGQTNTIAQNAAILGEYLDAVKQTTGAEQVDLLAHSMGGMISRYYIDRLMESKDVTQLIMLGSPSLGTACANLPASLGYYLPATLEIQPEYAIQIFNPQITHRRGVRFYILAGDPIANPAGSPCTDVPSDLVISRQSATGIPLSSSELPILHTELNTSSEAFDSFVRPLLQKGPGEYPDEPDPLILPVQADSIQFGQVFNGHLEPGQSEEIVIPIEAGVQVASFGLYDPSQSLNVEVRGASGNVIELSTENNSLIEVNDPRSMIYLGYGFTEPRPGVWSVTLLSSDQTPASGTDYALTARFVGGVHLEATTSVVLPAPGERVIFRVSMSLNGQDLDIQQVAGGLKDASNQTMPLDFNPVGDGYQATWEAGNPGLYGADFLVTAATPDGMEIQRSASLVLEVQPQTGQTRSRVTLILLAGGVLFVLVLVFLATALLARSFVRRHKK
jgi:pimeloyl-ACP methyl ester carboxylesterase